MNINRSYQKLQDVLASIGGFMRFILGFFGILNYYYSYHRSYLTIMNLVFDSQKSGTQFPPNLRDPIFTDNSKMLLVKREPNLKSDIHPVIPDRNIVQNLSTSKFVIERNQNQFEASRTFFKLGKSTNNELKSYSEMLRTGKEKSEICHDNEIKL